MQICCTALWFSAENNHFACCEALVMLKADVNLQDGCGWTPLHRAAMHGYTSIVELLLSKGADADIQDHE
jgi:uncharacterized protein